MVQKLPFNSLMLEEKAELETNALAPSAIPFNETMKMPIEMSKHQIKDTVLAFQQAAVRSKQAGFDVIEIHGAHGYLINEFLSPLTNKRTDEYGGSPENRYRFLREIIESINEVLERTAICSYFSK